MKQKRSSLFRQIVTGAGWNFIGQTARQVISLATMIILARLLSPDDFGLVAMTYVVSSFAYMFSTMGMGSAIIQRKEINDEYLSTAFWVSVVSGVIVTVFMICSGPIVAIFFRKSEITCIVAVLSLSFVFGGISVTHRSILTRRMAFKSIAYVEISGTCLGSLVAIFAAMNGMGYWSLVFQELVSVIVKVPLFWFAGDRWRPQLLFSRACFKELFGFSSYILLGNFVNYFNRNGDNIIIGRFLGAIQLGYYDRAYALMLKPLQYISYSVGRALFPALSNIQNDKEQVREIYLKMVKTISLITFPMMVGLSIIARDVILLVYGPKWEPVIPVFAVLCYVGLFQSIGTTVGDIYYSQGRSALAFKMTCIVSPFIWLAFWIGSFWGIQGVAFCYAGTSMAWWIISHAVANSLIDLKMVDFLLSLWPATVKSVAMGGVIFLLSQIPVVQEMAMIFRLSLLICIGAIIYLILLCISKDDYLVFLRNKIIVRLSRQFL